ncbi:hypothetical protein [Bacillus manliponensis]|uniref:hypothetical protein n=1 Tax=Bacillus manliponensis TaxID=574376 RepID=UPI00351894B7
MNNNLIKQYGFYVYYHSSFRKHLLQILILRSTIAFQVASLRPAEQRELHSYDQLFIHEAHQIYKHVHTLQHSTTYPPSHWWWNIKEL